MGCTVSKDNDIYLKKNNGPFKNVPVVFVSGIPGAGNRTVSENLSESTGFTPIYPGDLIRKRTPSDIHMKKEIKSEEKIIELVKDEMMKHEDPKGFIICRFPPNSKVLRRFEKIVKSPEKIIALQVNDSIAKNRLEKKLHELGKSSEEIKNIDKIIKLTKPVIKKLEKEFDKDNLIVMSSNTDLIDIEELTQRISQLKISNETTLDDQSKTNYLNAESTSTAELTVEQIINNESDNETTSNTTNNDELCI